MTPTATDARLHGRVLHYNFSPRGGLEGLIVQTADGVVQVVCPPHLAAAVDEGDDVELHVEPAPPSDKGPAAHPVYHLIGAPPRLDEPVGHVSGTVVRLNYAKHGEPNGVVLDTGDFVHLKPDGMRRTGLKVGQQVTAEGEARPMDLGGRVVEATVVNGIPVKGKPRR